MNTLAQNPACNPQCRACHYKNLDYPAQVIKKNEWARAQLGQWDHTLKEMICAPREDRLAYRTKSWLKASLGGEGTTEGERVTGATNAAREVPRAERDLEFSGGFGLEFGMTRAVQKTVFSNERDEDSSAPQTLKKKWVQEFISWDHCPLHHEAITEMIARLKKVLPEQAPEFTKYSLVGVWMGLPHVVLISKREAPANADGAGGEQGGALKGVNGATPPYQNSYKSELQKIDWTKVLVSPFTQAWFHANPQVGKKTFGHLPIHPLGDSEPNPAPSQSLSSVLHAAINPPSPPTVQPIRAFRQVARGLLQQARAQAVAHLLAVPAEAIAPALATPPLTTPSAPLALSAPLPAPLLASESPRPVAQSRPLVLDLYCGTGDLSQLLPAQIDWLGIELSQDAATFANTLKPAQRGLHQAFVGTVEDRLGDPRVEALLAKVKDLTLFINPPRSGLSTQASQRVEALLQKHRPARIAYLSCSASSLRRDLLMFQKNGYFVELLQPFDFFPQTEHFETLALLTF